MNYSARFAKSFPSFLQDLHHAVVFFFMPEVLGSFGVNPVEVLTAAGLSAQALTNPEVTVPYSVVGPLMENAADKTRCPHLGLELGKHIRTTTLGLVGELMRNASTLGYLRCGLIDFKDACLLANLHQRLFATSPLDSRDSYSQITAVFTIPDLRIAH